MYYYELTKREKKIARDCIEKGVQAEFKTGLEKAKQVISEWETNELNNREAYHKLYLIIQDHDKKIARRYDGITGSKYLVTVADILSDGQITQDDIKDFRKNQKQFYTNGLRMNEKNETKENL